VHINDHRYLLTFGAILFDRQDFALTSGCFWDEALLLFGIDGKASFDSALAAGKKPTDFKHSCAFPEGGFYLLQNDNFWIFADFGPRGISNATGVHGHHDATSFELAYKNETLIVDSGTYVYSADPVSHKRLKGTRAHNVVIVDDEEMGETPDGLWLLGDEAQAEVFEWSISEMKTILSGGHHGYERLVHAVSVSRDFILTKGNLTIVDSLAGGGFHDIELRFHSPLKPEGDREKAVFQTNKGSATLHFSSTHAKREFFVEESMLGVSYGVYQQGWAFGWRFKGVNLPFESKTKVAS
jgi:hypothetical protein